MNVAIVDDAKAVHAYLEELFEGVCETIVHYYNGQEAVDAFTKSAGNIDLVLLDWEMPVLSGIEALPKLRALHANLPIMMMTSKNAMSDIVLALENGAQDYVIKPFTKDILIGKIEQVLGKKVA
jgi:two-component system, chemotaxis family, chemotaxis protein CheY